MLEFLLITHIYVDDHLGDFFGYFNLPEISKAYRDFQFGTHKSHEPSLAMAYGASTVALDEHLTTILKHPHSIEAVISIPHMWRNINQAIEIIDGSNLEIRISRALAMWAVLSLHQWVKKVIDSAQSEQVKDTWINKLIIKIENALYAKGRAGTEITLKSSDFIPGLRERSTKFKKPGLSYNTKGVKEKTQKIAYDVIREWLNYPNDKKTLMQCEFLEIIVSRTQISILLLDIVWMAYCDPFKVIPNKMEG